MDTGVLCAYNLTRGVFLSSKVTVADPALQPLEILKVLVGGLGLDSVSGLWLSPLSGIPTVPRLFPFDILYLDRNCRLLDAAEVAPGVQFPAPGSGIASALVLPSQTLTSTRTAHGDRLIICSEVELERMLGDGHAAAFVPPDPPVLSNRPLQRLAPGLPEAGPRGAASVLSSAPLSSSEIGLAEDLVEVSAIPGHRASSGPRPGVAMEASKPPTETENSPPVAREITELPFAPIAAPDTPAKPENEGDQPELRTSVSAASVDLPLDSKPTENTLVSSGVEPPVVSANSAPSGAAGPIAATTPVMSVTELILESSEHALPSGEQADNFDELFSNWVEAPSLSSAWEARKPTSPNAAPADLKRQEAGIAKPLPELTEIPSKAADSKDNLEGDRADATSECEVAPEPKSGTAKIEPPSDHPLSGSTSTRTALLLPPHASTFTIGNNGMWRVSMPTAVAPVGSKALKPEQPQVAATASSAEAARRSTGDATANKLSTEPISHGSVASVSAATLSARAFAERIERTVRGQDSAEKHESAPGPALNVRNADEGHPPLAANHPPNAVIGDSAQARATSTTSPEKATPTLPGAVKTANSEKPKAAPRRIAANSKTQPQPTSLGARFKRWLNPVAPVRSDRRRAYRRYVPGMIAHYYTGGAPKPREVADISMTGFYLLTEDHWMPETMIQMTLQKPCAKGERKQSITVLSRIVRRGSDGVGAEFVTAETLDQQSHDVQPSQTTDKFALARFL